MDKIKQAVLVSSQKSTVQDRCTIHIMYLPLIDINVKKLQFIHKLTASDTSKTAKITSAHRLNVNVLLSNITFS